MTPEQIHATFEAVYPLACLFAAIVLPVSITTSALGRTDKQTVVRKSKHTKGRTGKRTKKMRTAKKQKAYKAPKLSAEQQAAIEPYRLGGNRFTISNNRPGGLIPE